MKYIVAAIILFGACVYANPQWNRDQNNRDRNDGDRNGGRNNGNDQDRDRDWNNDRDRQGNNRGNNRDRNDRDRDRDRDRDGNTGRNNGNDRDNDRDRQGNNRGRSQWRNRIFFERRGEIYAKCQVTQRNWYRYTWRAGTIRDYYIPAGPTRDLEECISLCERHPACYHATRTRQGNCYFLDTEATDHVDCKYFLDGQHYGRSVEYCTNRDPCPSAYRVCDVQMPNVRNDRPKSCTLVSIMALYCHTKNEDLAVQDCKPHIW